MKKMIVSLVKFFSLIVVLFGALFFASRGILEGTVNDMMAQIEYGPPIDPDQRSRSQVETTSPNPPQPHSGE